jgi:uncharacterized protein with HEPN domain
MENTMDEATKDALNELNEAINKLQEFRITFLSDEPLVSAKDFRIELIGEAVEIFKTRERLLRR